MMTKVTYAIAAGVLAAGVKVFASDGKEGIVPAILAGVIFFLFAYFARSIHDWSMKRRKSEEREN
jgi:hypothetical protein